jgi:hypothetical protein
MYDKPLTERAGTGEEMGEGGGNYMIDFAHIK